MSRTRYTFTGMLFLAYLCLSTPLLWAQNTAPEEKPGYDQSKDVGAATPKGGEALFDGTPQSIDANWKMWPKADMPVTWAIVDNPHGEGKVLMTDGPDQKN